MSVTQRMIMFGSTGCFNSVYHVARTSLLWAIGDLVFDGGSSSELADCLVAFVSPFISPHGSLVFLFSSSLFEKVVTLDKLFILVDYPCLL